jgi:hypothetical protein
VAAPDVLVQVHIFKCAGTSVANWLRNAAVTGVISGFRPYYEDNYVYTADQLWEAGFDDPRLTAATSHGIRRFPPTIHDRRIHYFTILRRPLPHFLSVVRYMLQERVAFAIPAPIGRTSKAMTAWLLSKPVGTEFRENTQTNHLALFTWCDATGGRCDPARYGRWPAADQALYERERLGVAKDVLRSFMVAGTVERLDETLELVRARSAAFGMNLPPISDVPFANVTAVPIDDIAWIDDDPLGERLRESFAIDAELHAFADRLLDEAYGITREQSAAS